jgi:hypothetical protein
MSYAFISYKREDEVRVSRLAKALEKSGVKVWWDPELERGENWHDELEKRLGEASCVIVCWSLGSVGEAGNFVRDEARRGMKAGILVPVMLDKKIPLPLGFGEVQTIDLSSWKGSVRDPFFQDLVAAVKAKMTGAPPPTPKGPKTRIARRLFYGATSSAFLGSLALFGFNSFGVTGKMCAAPGLQPGLSDVCGACRLGNRPTREERLAWAARKPGDCEALKAHINRFPEGAYRSEAAALLLAKKVSYRDVWSPVEHRLPLFIPTAADSDAAKARSLAAAQPQAQQLCQGFGSGTLFKFVSAKASADWSCTGGGCTASGWAVCELQQHDQVEEDTCEPKSAAASSSASLPAGRG